MGKNTQSSRGHKDKGNTRKKAGIEERLDAARQGRDVNDFPPHEARAGDPGRESNRGS